MTVIPGLPIAPAAGFPAPAADDDTQAPDEFAALVAALLTPLPVPADVSEPQVALATPRSDNSPELVTAEATAAPTLPNVSEPQVARATPRSDNSPTVEAAPPTPLDVSERQVAIATPRSDSSAEMAVPEAAAPERLALPAASEPIEPPEHPEHPDLSERQVAIATPRSDTAPEEAVPGRAVAEQAAPEAVAPEPLGAPQPASVSEPQVAIATPGSDTSLQVEARSEVDSPVSVRQPQVEAPHQQVVRALRPLAQGSDGTYRVSLALTPEHLGDIEVHLEMTDGQMHLRLVAEHADAREALRVALPELRQELASQGIQAGDLDVDDHPAQHAGDSWDSRDDNPRQPRDHAPEQPTAQQAAPARSVDANQTLDVRM